LGAIQEARVPVDDRDVNGTGDGRNTPRRDLRIDRSVTGDGDGFGRGSGRKGAALDAYLACAGRRQ